MKRALIVIFLVIAGVITSMITRLNSNLVTFNFYFDTIEIPLAVLIIASIIMGSILGVLFTVAMVFHALREKRRLRKKLKLCEKEIQNLRDIPIKGRH